MGATRAAENGATEHQLMAIFDWKMPGQARIYTKGTTKETCRWRYGVAGPCS